MTIPDPIAEICGVLLADAAVAALVHQRVFGGELPEAEAGLMPRPAVVLMPAGGPGRPGTVKYRRNRVDTTCYGASLNQAWQLHVAVREVLELLSKTAAGSLFSLEVSSDGALARHPATQWPTCYASYLLLSATVA